MTANGRIALIDYGAGNFTSVRNALGFLGLPYIEAREPRQLDDATHLILPGVGAFAAAMRKIETRQFVSALERHVLGQGKPFLGICVGMQVLATLGLEFGECRGLGLVPGVVANIPAETHGLRLPHIGWNEVTLRGRCPLFTGMGKAPIFYFVHSYQLVPDNPDVCVGTCTYGGEVVAAVQDRNIFGVQFHPEKSQRDGLQLLRNFAAIQEAAGRC